MDISRRQVPILADIIAQFQPPPRKSVITRSGQTVRSVIPMVRRGGTVETESIIEANLARNLDFAPHLSEFAFQPFEALITTADGELIHRYTPDALAIYGRGVYTFECKPVTQWLRPDVRADFVVRRAFFGRQQMTLLSISQTEVGAPITLANLEDYRTAYAHPRLSTDRLNEIQSVVRELARSYTGTETKPVTIGDLLTRAITRTEIAQALAALALFADVRQPWADPSTNVRTSPFGDSRDLLFDVFFERSDTANQISHEEEQS